MSAPTSRSSTPTGSSRFGSRRGSGGSAARVEKTAATAGRVARLVESMHAQLEQAEADRDALRQRVDQEALDKEELATRLRRLDGYEARNAKIELIAGKMKEETQRIRRREEDLTRREQALLSQQQQQASTPSTLTVEKVRGLYRRVAQHGGGDGVVATRSALLRCLQADPEIRSLFLDSSCGEHLAAIERLLSSPDLDPGVALTWEEFSLAVLGPQHPSLADTAAALSTAPSFSAPPPAQAVATRQAFSSAFAQRQQQQQQPCCTPDPHHQPSPDQYGAESVLSSDIPDPSPPPPRHPDLSPMVAVTARAPSPPSTAASYPHHPPPTASASAASSMSLGCPPSSASARSASGEASSAVSSAAAQPPPPPPPQRSSSPYASEAQLAAMASVLVAADIDPYLSAAEPVAAARDAGVPFVDVTFPPSCLSAPPACEWARASGGELSGGAAACSAVSGLSSDRLFLSVLCLAADASAVVPPQDADLAGGHSMVRLGGNSVVVDTFFPSVDSCAVHAAAGPGQLWVMLAEKAYAKLRGGYSQMERCRSSLADVVSLVLPGAAARSFPLSFDALPDFMDSARAGHLQLLSPLPTSASKLSDIGCAYSVQGIHPRDAVDAAHALFLVWCPVVSQGADPAESGDVAGGSGVGDMRWISADDLCALFSDWALIDGADGRIAQRRALPAPAPAAPGSAEGCDVEAEDGAVCDDGVEEEDESRGRSPSPRACVVSSCEEDGGGRRSSYSLGSLHSIEREAFAAAAVQPQQQRQAEERRQRSGSAQSSASPPPSRAVEEEAGWNEAVAAVMQSNGAVMLEMRQHKAEADRAVAEARRLRDALAAAEEGRGTLLAEVDALRGEVAEADEVLRWSGGGGAELGSAGGSLADRARALQASWAARAEYELRTVVESVEEDGEGEGGEACVGGHTELVALDCVWRASGDHEQQRQALTEARAALAAERSVAEEASERYVREKEALRDEVAALKRGGVAAQVDAVAAAAAAAAEAPLVAELRAEAEALRRQLEREAARAEGLREEVRSFYPLGQRVDDLEAEVAAKAAEVARLEEAAGAAALQSEELVSSVQGEAHEKITESVGQVRRLQADVEEALATADARYEELRAEHEELQARHAAAHEKAERLDGVEERLKAAAAARGDAEQELKITLTQLELQQDAHKKDLAQLRRTAEEAEQAAEALRARDSKYKARIEEAVPQLQGELKAALGLHAELSAKHQSVVAEMEELRAQRQEEERNRGSRVCTYLASITCPPPPPYP